MPDPKRVVIVGGGITGLSAAHAAIARARETGRAASVTVLEGSARFGGNLVTERVDGFLLDGGPDSWVANKPHASALAAELGLGGRLVGTNASKRRFFIAHRGRLHAVPEGLVLGVPTELGPLARTRLFSWPGKLRMALEPLIPARRGDAGDDESIADFARRRLGREAADRLVAPLLGGISAGDASDLSVRSAFPQLVAIEREHGSLVRGMRAVRRERAKASGNGSAFVSLPGGMGELVDALVARLGAEGAALRAGAPVRAVARTGSAWLVALEGGESLVADDVLLAVPGHVAAALLAPVDDGLQRILGRLRSATTATVFLGYDRAELRHPLDGVGFVVPRAANRPILAGTWVSSKWEGRAPDGRALLRVFFGGPSAQEALAADDATLVELARHELRTFMAIEAGPVLARVFRFDRASAQMRVGHARTMADLRARLSLRAPGLDAAGGGYDGIGIPDCIRQGQERGRALIDGPA